LQFTKLFTKLKLTFFFQISSDEVYSIASSVLIVLYIGEIIEFN